MSRRPLGALAGIAVAAIALLPVGAGAAAAPRDLVVDHPGPSAARTSAAVEARRYPVDDGTGATIAVSVTPACRLLCSAAEPQRIARFVGSLLHGEEIESLTVQLDAPAQIRFDCGGPVSACYFPDQGRIVLSGDDAPAPDGASRELVLAHEYGHHVAAHRPGPAPFPAPVLWGTPRWSTHEDVCRLSRGGLLFPGAGEAHYYEDPGEAFAEAFARLNLPGARIGWKWARSLMPDAEALRAIREDTLDPWLGRTGFIVTGTAPPHDGGAAVRSIRTPLDGSVRIRGSRLPRGGIELGLRDPLGRGLGLAPLGLGPRPSLEHTVCGSSHLGVVLRSTRRESSAFLLRVLRP